MDTFDFYLRKMVVIVYVTVLNYALSTVMAQLIKRFVAKSYSASKSVVENVLMLVAIVSSVALSNYLVRQVLSVVPKPFASEGFDPNRVGEVKGNLSTAFAYFTFLAGDVSSYKVITSFI